MGARKSQSRRQENTPMFSRRQLLALGAVGGVSIGLPGHGPAMVRPENETKKIAMPDRITHASAVTQAHLICAGHITPLELAHAVISEIKRVDERIGAVEYLAEQSALEEAEQATKAIQRGNVNFDRQQLYGVLFGVKDSLDVKGMPTTSGAPSLVGHIAESDATVVARLRAAGGIPVVKTRMPLHGISHETINSFGTTNNPYDFDRTAGGSSGGAGALSAAGGTPFDIGVDGGASIRNPAHCCGVAGLAPAFGRVSIKGVFPPLENRFALNYLSVGPIARRIKDVGIVYDIISGVDPHDPFTWPLPKHDYRKVDLQKLRIGFWAEANGTNPTPETVKMVENCAKALQERGANVGLVPCPFDPREATAIWFSHAVDDLLEKMLNEIAPQCGADADPMIVHCRDVPAQFRAMYSNKDIERLRLKLPQLREQVSVSMGELDVVLCPVKASPALAHFSIADVVLKNLEHHPYTHVYGLVHSLPGGTVRCSASPEGLPLGVHVVGSPGREDYVLAVLDALEQEFGGWQPSPLLP